MGRKRIRISVIDIRTRNTSLAKEYKLYQSDLPGLQEATDVRRSKADNRSRRLHRSSILSKGSSARKLLFYQGIRSNLYEHSAYGIPYSEHANPLQISSLFRDA